MRVTLPRAQPGDDPIEVFNRLVTSLEQQLARSQPSGQAYSVTNATPLRTLDATTATLAQVAQALATVIQDVQSGGLLR